MFPVLHLDNDCVAVLKPCGVAAVPERAGDPDCLCARLAQQLGRRVYPVHRLDKEVSGVILYALTADAHRFLNTAFERREVRKAYLAVVHGAMPAGLGVIDRPLREFGSGRMGVDNAKGKPSETRYDVIQTNDRFSLVHLHPLTGRRHQLRAHLYSVGHPIAGDTRYGDRALRDGTHPRLMLTSTGLALRLPSGGALDLHDAVPGDFREAAARVYGFEHA
ncbi:MAG: RNA pseudouridine synthase [Verrucomicrobiota bacterium]|jgi:RluA family pseudouridine synthase|nr:RNA pseudouridine synthase [Verrucomicrobiota bacterium]